MGDHVLRAAQRRAGVGQLADVGGQRVGGRLVPAGMAAEHDVVHERPDHGRPTLGPPVARLAHQVVDAGGRGLVDAEGEPRGTLVGLVRHGPALDPADVGRPPRRSSARWGRGWPARSPARRPPRRRRRPPTTSPRRARSARRASGAGRRLQAPEHDVHTAHTAVGRRPAVAPILAHVTHGPATSSGGHDDHPR